MITATLVWYVTHHRCCVSLHLAGTMVSSCLDGCAEPQGRRGYMEAWREVDAQLAAAGGPVFREQETHFPTCCVSTPCWNHGLITP